MKTLRRISGVTILCLMLTVSVLAGQVDSPGAPVPPPPQGSGAVSHIVLIILGLVYR